MEARGTVPSARSTFASQSSVAGAGLVQAALQDVEQRLVAGDQLHLELPEAVDLARALEDRDPVRGDLGLAGAVADAHAVAARAQRGRRSELAAAEVGGEELEELLRRHRTALGLDLEPPGRVRQRQLPP